MDEQEQPNEVQEEQNVQMEPTPLSSSSSHKNLIIGIVAGFVLVVAGIAGAYFVFHQPLEIKELEVKEVSEIELLLKEPVIDLIELSARPFPSEIGSRGYDIEFTWDPLSLPSSLSLWVFKGEECGSASSGYGQGLLNSFEFGKGVTQITKTFPSLTAGSKVCTQLWDDFYEGIIASSPVLVVMEPPQNEPPIEREQAEGASSKCYTEFSDLYKADACCADAVLLQLSPDEQTEWKAERYKRFSGYSSESDESSCSQYGGTYGQKWCSSVSEENCKKGIANRNYVAENELLIQQAIETKDANICNTQLREPWKSNCLKDVAIAIGDATSCAELSDVDDRSGCYDQLALALNDPSLCDEIQHSGRQIQPLSYRKEKCRERVKYKGEEIPERSRPYANEQYDYSGTYPWPLLDVDGKPNYFGDISFALGGDTSYGNNIKIETIPFDKKYGDLEQFVDGMIQESLPKASSGTVTLEEKKKLEVSQHEAYQVTFLNADGRKNIHTFILSNNRLYEISMTVEPSVFDTLSRAYSEIVSTFTIYPIAIVWDKWGISDTELAPGFEFERIFSFVAKRQIQNAKIILTETPPFGYPHPPGTPPYPQYVIIEPATLNVIESGKTYNVTLQFSVPDGHPTTQISYYGLLSVHEGGITLGSPLRVNFEIGSSFVNFPDNSVIVTDPEGGVYPVDQLMLNFTDGVTRKEASDFIESIPAKVIGYLDSINSYAIQVNAQTIEELENILESIRLRNDNRLEGVFRNYVMSLF